MTTKLNKQIKRITNELRRDRSHNRNIIITLYPSGVIGLRLKGLRSEETIPMQVVYERAVKMRLAAEQRTKDEKRAAKAGVPYHTWCRRKRRSS